MKTNQSLILFAAAGQRWARLLGSKLERSGKLVRYADSMTKILRCLESSNPALIVLDQEVVGEKCSAFVELLRRRAGQTRIILLTPSSSSPRSAPSEAWGHLWKPVDLGLLLSAIESALGESLEQDSERGHHVLCVDDDPLFLRSLERILTRYDYRVTCFQNPECVPEALPLLEPDLAILDLKMPRLGGRSLARILRNEDPDGIPILFLTGNLWAEDESEGPRGSRIHYLSKPAEPESVLAAIEELLARTSTADTRFLVRR
jgi:DNA-binding response OmpR family regulator